MSGSEVAYAVSAVASAFVVALWFSALLLSIRFGWKRWRW